MKREPVIWLDKACIDFDGDEIDDQLKCLPLFLMGCSVMLVLEGPQYTTRLWCIIEAFTFLYCVGGGANIRKLQVSPLVGHESPTLAQLNEARHAMHRRLAALDAGNAKCFAADTDRLLGAIEGGFGSLEMFNRTASEWLLRSAKRGLTASSMTCLELFSFRSNWLFPFKLSQS